VYVCLFVLIQFFIFFIIYASSLYPYYCIIDVQLFKYGMFNNINLVLGRRIGPTLYDQYMPPVKQVARNMIKSKIRSDLGFFCLSKTTR